MPPAFSRTRASRLQRLIETRRLLETWHLLEHWPQPTAFITVRPSICSEIMLIFFLLILSVDIYLVS